MNSFRSVPACLVAAFVLWSFPGQYSEAAGAGAEAVVGLDSPRNVVAEFLRRIKAVSETEGDAQRVWELTTRTGNASWGSDLTVMARDGIIHPIRQLGNDEQTIVLSAPFQYQGRERVFSALLLKRAGQWLIDRHDAYRSPAEARSLMEGFLLNSSVKFDVQASELVGEWHFPCASTLTLFADGKGVRVYEGPSGVPEKPERFRWEVSGFSFRTHWPDRTDTATISWVADDELRLRDVEGRDAYFGDHEAAIAPGSPHEVVIYDPRTTRKKAHCFGIDAGRQRMLDEKWTPKLDVADPHETDEALITWATKHRVDAVGRVEYGAGSDGAAPGKGPGKGGKVTRLGLRTFKMLTIPAAEEAWEKMTRAEIEEKIRARLAEWSFISQVNDVLTDGKAAGTFLFQTRDGSQGLLQIVGPSADNGVKILYKVTKETGD